ncbi:MAG: TrpR family protein YerC/YecD [Parcubacteria group bacterium GW2011_GWA2_46_9]|nr:MAG: TrpR family protein YerC/YecD [Parcubacteria group bacterium GW2011_GWA2_46_9]
MPRMQPQHLNDQERIHLLDLLWTSVSELSSRDEVRAFFKDLLSESEAIMLARRIKIAQLLLQGKSYEYICKTLHTSDSTIATVHNWLSGGFHGYESTIKKFEQVVIKRQQVIKSKKAEPYTYEWLKRKYPLHFLLFRLFDDYSDKRNLKIKDSKH